MVFIVIAFVWVVLYRTRIVETGHCIPGVVVFNGSLDSLCSQVYGKVRRIMQSNASTWNYTQNDNYNIYMFLSSQHQTSAVETEDVAHAFDLLDLFLCICCCLASLVPVPNLWSRYISGCLTCQYRERLRIPGHYHM